jgi:hypothetical protein
MEMVGSLEKIGISRGASIAAPAEAVQFNNSLVYFHSEAGRTHPGKPADFRTGVLS